MGNLFAASSLLTGTAGPLSIVTPPQGGILRLKHLYLCLDPSTYWASGLCSFKFRAGLAGADIQVMRAISPEASARPPWAQGHILCDTPHDTPLPINTPLVLYISDAAVAGGPIVSVQYTVE